MTDAPIPAGALCMFGAYLVRAYATISVGEVWDGMYRCYLTGSNKLHGLATREQLEVFHG